jgi:hypothetical protein
MADAPQRKRTGDDHRSQARDARKAFSDLVIDDKMAALELLSGYLAMEQATWLPEEQANNWASSF